MKVFDHFSNVLCINFGYYVIFVFFPYYLKVTVCRRFERIIFVCVCVCVKIINEWQLTESRMDNFLLL